MYTSSNAENFPKRGLNKDMKRNDWTKGMTDFLRRYFAHDYRKLVAYMLAVLGHHEGASLEQNFDQKLHMEFGLSWKRQAAPKTRANTFFFFSFIWTR